MSRRGWSGWWESLGVGLLAVAAATAVGSLSASGSTWDAAELLLPAVGLMTLDPGHFHAALLQREMYPGVDRRVHVYAPLGFDLTAHLDRIARFNLRPDAPTTWELEIHTGPDFVERMLRERPGNVVVVSGRNRGKIDRIKASVEAGLNVLADKPWIIAPGDLPAVEAALDTAEQNGLVAYDIMTERYEITSILQRELLHDPATFGHVVAGSPTEPGVYMESVHHLAKTVAGAPLLRPAWFFDVTQQGEGVPDVGTHLVDLVQWMLFPEQAVDYRRDIQVLAARRWPTVMTRAEFGRVTGETDFPGFLEASVKQGKLEYYGNGMVAYTVRGVHVKLDTLWNYAAPAGAGDRHLAVFRGSRSSVEVRQAKDDGYRPELYVIPNRPELTAPVLAALEDKIAALQTRYPGIAVEDLGVRMRVTIPDRYRLGHEAHFAEVASRFLEYLRDPTRLPAWEKPNMLAKYHVTTTALALSHAGGSP